MEIMEAKILLKSLLKRVKQVDEDSFELKGLLTDDELTALKLALSALDNSVSPSTPVHPTPTKPIKEPVLAAPQELAPTQNPEVTDNDKPIVEKNIAEQAPVSRLIELDTSVLSLTEPASDERLCLDFGTAMSKVTLVKDKSLERDFEEIHVLHLGVPGDQEEVSETMLISSVFIDPDGKVWFGKKALDWSKFYAGLQRLDNIKRYLSEEGFNEPVSYGLLDVSYVGCKSLPRRVR
jgi:hypothetical protein